MKTPILIGLSALALSLVATPTLAQEISQNSQTSTSSIVEITPFDLVYGAYQGNFTNSGIPGYANFITAVNTGQVEAKDLVEEAIAKGRLTPDTIDNRGYLSSVDELMRTIDES